MRDGTSLDTGVRGFNGPRDLAKRCVEGEWWEQGSWVRAGVNTACEGGCWIGDRNARCAFVPKLVSARR